jgi:hypothetical protein
MFRSIEIVTASRDIAKRLILYSDVVQRRMRGCTAAANRLKNTQHYTDLYSLQIAYANYMTTKTFVEVT